jgi:hypothetical protein
VKVGDTVWIHPHGSRRDVVPATVETVSSNQRAIAVRLHDKPVWCRIDDGFLLHREHGEIAMLLYREKFGPWIEIVHQGHYEIEETEPR